MLPMLVDILFSAVVALTGTIFIVLVSLWGTESRRLIYIVSIISFVVFFVISFYFNLPDIIWLLSF